MAGQVEAFAAANVAAGDHVVNADHVRAGFREMRAVFFMCAGRELIFFGAELPAYRIRIFLAAVRTGQRNLLGFLFFVIEFSFVHGESASVVLRAGKFGQAGKRVIDFIGGDEFQSGVFPTRQPVSERVDNVVAVSVGHAMVGVVHEDDVSACGAAKAANHAFGRLRAPVAREARPHGDARVA